MNITEALAAFTRYMDTRALAPATRLSTMTYVGYLADACRGGRLDQDAVDAYYARLRPSTATRNKATSVLRQILGHLERIGYLQPGDAARLMEGRTIKPFRRDPKAYVEADRFPELLDAAGPHRGHRAAMALALYTLARKGEIVSLQLRNYDGKKILIYRSKTAEWTEVTACPDLRTELAAWLNFYADVEGYDSVSEMTAEHPEWFLVPRLAYNHADRTYATVPGRKMDRYALEGLAKRALTALQITGTTRTSRTEHKGEGMHTIRRSGARAMYLNLAGHGVDDAANLVRAMCNHANTSQTLVYIGVDLERERLNRYLEHGSMFGPARRGRRADNVIPLTPREDETADEPSRALGRAIPTVRP